MSTHSFKRFLLATSLIAGPGASLANGLDLPGLVPVQPYPRAGYREAVFPPPQHNVLGMPVPPPALDARPGYRAAYNDFPPPGGRFGGGIVEYVKTGGRPEPVGDVTYPAPLSGSLVGPVQVAASGYEGQDAYPAGYAPPTPITGMAPLFGSDAGVPESVPAPVYAVAPNPLRGSLPQGGLPDYQGLVGAPAQPMVYGAPTAAATYAPGGAVARPSDPLYERQVVAYSGHERPGTIVIDTPDKFLYLVQGNGSAIRYGIGVGRPGFEWSGVKHVSRKAEWPGWTPPREMVARRPDLPRHMVGGIENPLGARAMYLGSSLYRIHGTNEPDTIGTNVSSGCIRMMNQDVIDLYGRVPVGTKVVVL